MFPFARLTPSTMITTAQTRTLTFEDLGLIDYQQGWDYQEQCFQNVMRHKLRDRELPQDQQSLSPGYLLFCEHKPVVTMGKTANADNLLVTEEWLRSHGVSSYKINRGGDVTFHGPGQLVGYPIIDLDYYFTDVGRYMRYLEEVIIRTLADYSIESERLKGATGVWLDVGTVQERKIASIGIRCSRWITMHGWAFNVNTDLKYFELINPCGLSKPVTSLQVELGREVDMAQLKEQVRSHFGEVFECTIRTQQGQQIRTN